MTDLFSAVVTLFLIMDPLGNVPVFLSVLKEVAPERRRVILIREVLIAYAVLLVFLFLGNHVLRVLNLDQETISIAGGIVLFLIALRMIFPERSAFAEAPAGEPFVVPLAIPLIAGPSTLAALLLLQRSEPGATWELWGAVTIAWVLTAIILLAAPFLYRVLHRARPHRTRAPDGHGARHDQRADAAEWLEYVSAPLSFYQGLSDREGEHCRREAGVARGCTYADTSVSSRVRGLPLGSSDRLHTVVVYPAEGPPANAFPPQAARMSIERRASSYSRFMRSMIARACVTVCTAPMP